MTSPNNKMNTASDNNGSNSKNVPYEKETANIPPASEGTSAWSWIPSLFSSFFSFSKPSENPENETYQPQQLQQQTLPVANPQSTSPTIPKRPDADEKCSRGHGEASSQSSDEGSAKNKSKELIQTLDLKSEKKMEQKTKESEGDLEGRMMSVNLEEGHIADSMGNASQKSLIEDKTVESDSTAKAKSLRTATTQQSPDAETAFFQVQPPPAAAAAENSEVLFPVGNVFNETRVSLSDDDIQQQEKRYRSSIIDTYETFFGRVHANIYRLQADHVTWIRRLRNQNWIHFADVTMTGFTLMFFAIAFYFIFHINPSLEFKLIPEFYSAVNHVKQTGNYVKQLNNFENCNHESWIATDNSTAPIIDDRKCFSEYDYGKVFFEIYKSLSPNSTTNGCNIDRVEVHPCYEKNVSNDPMEIFWGPPYTDREYREMYFCYATPRYRHDRDQEVPSINNGGQKHAMLNLTNEFFMNRIAPSAAFYFQCPKCSLGDRLFSNLALDPPKMWIYEIVEIAPSIPTGAAKCERFWPVSCSFNENDFVQYNKKSFSQQALPFFIVDDRAECISK